MMVRVMKNYVIMRARLKISYSTFIKGMTFSELWITQLQKSFLFLKNTDQIPTSDFSKEEQLLFDSIINLKIPDVLRRCIKYQINRS